jgi:subtilisin family serine protease
MNKKDVNMADREFIVLRSKRLVVPEAGSRGAVIGPSEVRGGVEMIELEAGSLTQAERADLRRDSRVQAIAETMPMKLIEPTATNEVTEPAAADATWGIKAVRAMDSPFTGNGIAVAVLDTGIDPNHVAFQGMELVRKNFTAESDDDGHGHGTHCAGTIFGRDVGNLRIGVARGVQRAIIGKVLGAGGGSSASLASAIQWAVNEGASIISMSLGIDFPGFVKELVNVHDLPIESATSIALEQYRANVNLFTVLAESVQAQGLFGQGAMIIAASGNESNRPTFEIAVAPPAAGTGVIAIGALQEGVGGFSVAHFSNNQVDVSAPGVNVISARRGGGLTSMSGTSMATPHAAGVATLWAQKFRDATGGVEIKPLITQLIGRADTSVLAASFEEDDVGTGIVQAPLS